MAKTSTTMRVLLSCTCLNRKPIARYGRTLEGLARATQGWMNRGGHGNPNHTPTIQVEAMRFARSPKDETALRRHLAQEAVR
jgi:hypothetical protein